MYENSFQNSYFSNTLFLFYLAPFQTDVLLDRNIQIQRIVFVIYITPFLLVAICVDIALVAWQRERKVFSITFSNSQLILVCSQY